MRNGAIALAAAALVAAAQANAQTAPPAPSIDRLMRDWGGLTGALQSATAAHAHVATELQRLIDQNAALQKSLAAERERWRQYHGQEAY